MKTNARQPIFAGLLSSLLRLILLYFYAEQLSWPTIFCISFAIYYMAYLCLDKNNFADSHNPIFVAWHFVVVETNTVSQM